MRRLSAAELAAESGTTPDVVSRLAAAGAITSDAAGQFPASDGVVVSTAGALLDAAIQLDDIVWLLETGQLGLGPVARLFDEPSARSDRTYEELAADLGDDAQHLRAVFAALGLPEPEPGDRPRASEVRTVLDFVRLWSLVDPTGEAHVRVARLVGDATRRIAEGWLDVWDEIARPEVATQGAPTVGARGRPTDPTDPAQNPSIGMAALGRRLVALVHERHLEATLNSRILSGVERILGEAGRLPARPRRPPAVAFVDLAGFTTMTAERGDEEAARVASRLVALAEEAVVRGGGRVVKQLGDGVLLRFADAPEALATVEDLVAAIDHESLPPAHAGIAAGAVIVRDGDVFGLTVNLAARLASTAGPRETLVEEGVVVALPAGTAAFDPVGRLELKGIPGTVAVWRVRSRDAAGVR